MDQTPLGHLDTVPIPRDAGRVRGVATARVIPSQAGLVIGHVSPDYSRLLRE